MENFKSILWILLYVLLIVIVPGVVVFLTTFITGLGFYLRDLKYDIAKALKKKASPP